MNNVHIAPLVSVIIATYKRSHELQRAVDSLISQTYQPLEIIVVDDNNDPEYQTIVRSIVDEYRNRIILIQDGKNRGSAQARNIGIGKANGEYITFLDDDDEYENVKIERQVEKIVEDDADFCITDLVLYTQDGMVSQIRSRWFLLGVKQSDLLALHLKYHLTGTDTLMFRREYLESIGRFPLINIGDEFYLMYNAIKAGGKISYLSRCDVKAYIHKGGLSTSKGKNEAEKELYSFKKAHYKQLTKSDAAYIDMRHYLVLAYVNMVECDYLSCVKYALLAFIRSPMDCILTVYGRNGLKKVTREINKSNMMQEQIK